MIEALSSSSTISEICWKYYVASSAVYKRRDEFIFAGTAAMEHGRSTTEASLKKEINELKGIIEELKIANETLRKIQATRRIVKQLIISFQSDFPDPGLPILQE